MRRRAIRWAAAVLLASGATPLTHARAADDPVWTPRDGWLPVPEVRAPERVGRQEDATALLEADPTAAMIGVRVVDERTRAPIAGAKLIRFQVADELVPLGRPVRAGDATSTPDGLVSLPRDTTEGGWWVVEAKGYAPFQTGGVPRMEVGLRPGRRVEARLLDPMGAPLADAEVLVFHGWEWPAPVLARARTAVDGRLVLEQADVANASLAVFGQPGVLGFLPGSGPYRVSHLAGLGSQVRDVALAPGIDIRGRVIDERGVGLAGALVGTHPDGRSAAPILTNATGEFELFGVQSGSSLFVDHPAARALAGVALWGGNGDAPVLLRVGPNVAPSDEAGSARPVDVAVEVPSGLSHGHIGLRILRDDGRTWLRRTERGSRDVALGTARFGLPPGRYRVTTEDRFQRVSIPPTEFTVTAAGPTTIHVKGHPQPALRTVGLPALEPATLVIPGQQTHVITELRALQGTFLPADAPAWVEWRGFRFPVGPEKDGERVATIVRPPPTIVRWSSDWPVDSAALLLDERGVAADADPTEQHLETYATGPVILRVVLDLQGTLDVPIELPAEVGGVVNVDLGPAFRARSRVASVRVRAPDDGPSRDVRAWVDHGAPDGVFEIERPLEPFDAGVPSRVRLESPGKIPLVLTVTEAREHVLAWGSASCELVVTGPRGEPLDAVASIDGQLLRVHAGRLSVGGLGEGPHPMVVSPRRTLALRAVETTITLGATETRRLQVRLPAR